MLDGAFHWRLSLSSDIRFIEGPFGILEPNITPWGRAVVGDLILVFDSEPPTDPTVPLPSSAEFVVTGRDGVADPAIGEGIPGARDVVAGGV